MNLLSVCWKPFSSSSEESSTTTAVAGVNDDCGGFEKDGLLWHRDIGGDYSMAVVQANQVLEDQSQIIESFGTTFVGVYDGHGGPDGFESKRTDFYVTVLRFGVYAAILARDYGVVTPETIRSAFLQTENGFTTLVSEQFNVRPSIATVGSCCLVGVIYQQTLFIANLGDSRVVLGKKVGNTSGVAAIQLSSEHNANLEEIRHELKNLHPHDPLIVALKHGVWRVKGIIQVSRSIGDVYMKHSEYNTEQIAQKFRLPESTAMPILSATPSIITHDIHPNDSFLIFASDGLWEHLSNEEAVEIVHSNPRSGIAKRLVKAALQEAAKKREMRYSDLKKIDKRVRRHFHDDITVIVLFLNYDQICRGAGGPNVSLRSALEH
ncbi:hypothetical protein SSX86_023762 [Deinandra increscens subsp. villosa]|uniref:protein-serine/threonine phosphatase n=1 Tax=Deinandra increscens subsp. villosa TaxID=3103831 RepID=A0AAP0CTD0_9ASTR